MRFITAAISSMALAAACAAAPAMADHHKTMDHSTMDHSKMGQDGHQGMDHAVHHAVMAAVANPNRGEDAKRDQWRHPVETLMFFDVRPDMKVGEYAPGGGWYSKVLGNLVSDDGALVGLFFDANIVPMPPERQQGVRDEAAGFAAKAAEWTGKPQARFAGYTLDNVPEAEKGTYDRILIIRMLHNLMRWNMADSELAVMRDLLADDGMIGIVQHRANSDAPYSYSNGSKGYLRQDDVIKFMQVNGFELVGMSNINANPMDSADHDRGVWEMPPVLASKRDDLASKGESDRMTLLFKKRM